MVWYENYTPQLCVGVIIAIFVLIWLLSPDNPTPEVNITPAIPGYYTGTLSQVSTSQVSTSQVSTSQPPTEQVSTSRDLSTEPVVPSPCSSTTSCGKFESKGEQICRQVLENHYGVPFPSIRPNWLKSGETKRNLELDCYNDELKLAVEYNGIQHYKWPNFTNQSKEAFFEQSRRDKFKVDRCRELGIYLLIVPYSVQHHLIPEYILSNLPEIDSVDSTE